MTGWPLAVVLISCLIAVVIVAVSVVWLVITTGRPPREGRQPWRSAGLPHWESRETWTETKPREPDDATEPIE